MCHTLEPPGEEEDEWLSLSLLEYANAQDDPGARDADVLEEAYDEGTSTEAVRDYSASRCGKGYCRKGTLGPASLDHLWRYEPL